MVVPVLPYEKYTLPNGPEVILYENHKLPLVAVDFWFTSGSAVSPSTFSRALLRVIPLPSPFPYH
jgi:predicted Zn-dependent peptidase